MLPNASISKVSGGTAGAAPPSPTGINAIIAAAGGSTALNNVASSYATQSNMFADFKVGPLAEYGSYNLSVSQKPSVMVPPNTTTVGTYVGFSAAVTGTCVVTTSAGTSTPLDEYAYVQVTIVTGGTTGVTGIQYQYTLDGNTTQSGVINLGTALTITLPVYGAPAVVSSGVSFALSSGQTLLVGDSFSCYTTRPQANNSDLIAALEALRITQQPWENVLIDCDATSTTVNTVDTWLASLEQYGQFHGAFLNSRHKTEPIPTAETETAFATAMQTAFSSVSASASLAVCVGSDAGDLPSQITGITQPRPMSLALAARCALIPPGEDPAYVNRGSVPGFGIADAKGNPKYHNESLYPNLDSLRLSTFTTQPGSQGVYITNGNVLSPSGSAFVYAQHMRCMNIACTQAFAQMVQCLGRGVGKKAPDPVTGNVYIAEQDAAAIEQQITAVMRQALKGQVVDVVFQMSRTDDLRSNAGATVHGQVQVEAFAYIKQFVAQAAFVKAITIPV